MGKLFILIGKSASGKDSVYKRLLEDPSLKLVPYVGFTTRPIRSGEQEGREYHFVTWEQLREYEASGRLIEKRVYHTVHGDWCYFSVDTEHVDLSRHDYLYIGTLESYLPLRSYYGEDRVIPLYLQVDDGVRLQRALDREKSQESPKYAEMCRRFLADEKDFAPERLAEAGVTGQFENIDTESCLAQLRRAVTG